MKIPPQRLTQLRALYYQSVTNMIKAPFTYPHVLNSTRRDRKSNLLMAYRLLLVLIVCIASACSDSSSVTRLETDGHPTQVAEPTTDAVTATTLIVETKSRSYTWGLQVFGPNASRYGDTIRTVVVIRGLQPDAVEFAKNHDLHVGGAYWKHANGTWEYIRDIDLRCSDYELTKEFGIPGMDELKKRLESEERGEGSLLEQMMKRYEVP
jgi:hypothetical protein